MKEMTREQKKANIRLALILAAVALVIAMWPLYLLRNGITG
jgi:hypothetical protein